MPNNLQQDLHEGGTVTLYNVHERMRGDYSFDLRDRHGVIVPGSVLTAARMSLYLTSPVGTPVVFVNGRQSQDILNTNNVTIDEAGHLTWDIQSADTAMSDVTIFFEPRIAVFTLEWPEGLVIHEAAFNVRNIPQAP